MNSIGGIQKPESIIKFVLYDKNTGDIRHIHQEIFFPGAKTPDKELIKESAFRLGKQVGLETTNLGVLDVSQREFKPHVRYRVDLEESPALVEVPEKAPI